jgi:hypothetical protein
MKRNIISLLIPMTIAVIMLLMTSCTGEDDPGEIAKTQISFSNPELVGILPDGRHIMVVKRHRGSDHDHHIYFVENTISANMDVPRGKGTVGSTTVTIDGVIYVPYQGKKEAR